MSLSYTVIRDETPVTLCILKRGVNIYGITICFGYASRCNANNTRRNNNEQKK